jgi:hypothetical protein
LSRPLTKGSIFKFGIENTTFFSSYTRTHGTMAHSYPAHFVVIPGYGGHKKSPAFAAGLF